jgi:hypothetical protein
MPLAAHPTLAAAAAIAAVSALVHLHVGSAFLKRPAATPQRVLALRMFAVWWVATGANILIASAFIAAASAEWTHLGLQLAYAVVQRLLLALALTGLVYYLLVLLRGRARLWPIVLFYSGYCALLLWSLFAGDPIGVYVGDWRTDLTYANPDFGAPWLRLVNGLALILPPVGLSIAAMVVARRLPPGQAAQHNRIVLVGSALVVWWVVAAIAGQQDAFGNESFQVFNRLLGLSMSLVVLAAYRSPAWLGRYIQTPRDASA